MGLFFNTQTDKIKREIQIAIQEANEPLRKIERITNSNESLTYIQTMEIYGHLAAIEQCRAKAKALIDQLTPLQIEQTQVSWLNGNVMPIALYEKMYSHIMAELDKKLKESL